MSKKTTTPAKTGKTEPEYMSLPIPMKLPFAWAVGEHLGRFYQELRDNAIIYGDVCPKCGLCLVPPRVICPRCFVRMDEWVEMGPRGTVLTYDVVQHVFWDPILAKNRPVPYTHAYIQLDGPDAGAFSHVLQETNPQHLKTGMRVEAVFKPKEQRLGEITDILYFKTVEDRK